MTDRETFEEYGPAILGPPLAQTAADERSAPTAFDIRPAGFFALRTPLLSFDTLLEWGADLTAPRAAAGPELESAAGADRHRLEKHLADIVDRPEVRAALLVASPDLASAVKIWRSDPGGDRRLGLTRALVRYLVRMATRPTPFGLFAGTSVGVLVDRSRLDVGAANRCTRLSVDYLAAVAREAANGSFGEIVYRLNDTCYRAAGTVRWVETVQAGSAVSYRLVGREDTETLVRVMDAADQGATREDLIAAATDGAIAADQADGYVRGLVGAQLLVPELEPQVTAGDPVQAFLDGLHRVPGRRDWVVGLSGAQQRLDELDRIALGSEAARRDGLAGNLAGLLAPISPTRELPGLVHVDLVRCSPQAALGPAAVAELERAIEILHRLAPAGPMAHIQRFCAAFAERYGARQVPLLEALDADTGIGFGPRGSTAAVLEGARPARLATRERPEWTERDEVLVAHVIAAAQTGVDHIELSSEDLDRLAGGAHADGSYGMAVVATVAARSEEDLDAGRFRIAVRALSTPSGAALLARFCHADPRLAEHVQRLVTAEEALDPEAVFAEVVHLPPGRLGNAVLRPAMRGYEIPYLGRPSVSADRQIPARDLLVSVHGDRPVLASRRLGRRIVPRITNAHASWRSSLPLYRFLGAIQRDVAPLPWWDWGPLDGQAFLPRVTSGRLVLAPARWRLRAAGMARFRTMRRAGDGERFAAVQQWRNEMGLPRWIALSENGEGLVVDLDNVLCVDVLVEALATRSEAVFEELPWTPDELCARGPSGRFVSELVVPFLRTGAMRANPPSASHRSPVSNAFAPGGEWLQVELYGPPSGADTALCEVISPLLRRTIDSGAADSWFFVRAFVPGPHLRVRFRGDASRLRSEARAALEEAVAPFVARGVLTRVQFGSYEREVERYGGPVGLLLSERIFQADSEAAMEFVRCWPRGDDALRQRWRVAFQGADILLADLGLPMDQRLQVACDLRDHTARVVAPDAELKTALSGRFRRERAALESLLDEGGGNVTAAGAKGCERLAIRSMAMTPLASQLLDAEAAGRLWVPVAQIAASCVHMQANRLLRSEHRAQELVIYDFLARIYRARLARVRDGPSTAGT